jgi:hypothetical protein
MGPASGGVDIWVNCVLWWRLWGVEFWVFNCHEGLDFRCGWWGSVLRMGGFPFGDYWGGLR